MARTRSASGIKRPAIALAAALLTATSLGVSASSAQADDTNRHRANAELGINCAVPPEHDPAIIRTVYDIAMERGANEKVLLSAFEAGWVESHMHNLDCGDRDSLGVFQQRPSQGWGTPEQCMDPVHATNKYLDQAIPNDVNNPGFTAGQLAQSVQRSAYPERYDQAEGKALEMIAEVRG